MSHQGHHTTVGAKGPTAGCRREFNQLGKGSEPLPHTHTHPGAENIASLLSKPSSCGQLGGPPVPPPPEASWGQEQTQNTERAINLCLPTTGLWHLPLSLLL